MIEGQEQIEIRKAESNIHIKELVFKYIRFWPLFVISILLSLTVAFFYLRWTTKIYISEGTFLVQTENSTGTPDKLEQVIMVDKSKDIQTEIEVLKARPLMERVVRKLQLNFSYLASGKVKALDVYKASYIKVEPVQLKDSTNAFALNVKFKDRNNFQVNNSEKVYQFDQVIQLPEGAFRFIKNSSGYYADEYNISWQPTLMKAVVLISSLNVTPRPNTGIVNILMETTNPAMSADIINQLMKEYSAVNIEDKNITMLQKLEFIEKRIQLVGQELDSINDRFVAVRQKYKIIDPEQQAGSYLKRIEESNEKLNDQREQIINAGEIEKYVSSNAADPVPSSLGIKDPTLNSLVDSYNKVQLEKKELEENAPPGNLLVQQKKQQADLIRRKIIENVQNIRSTFGKVLGSIQSRSNSVGTQMGNIPFEQRVLGDIQRDLETKSEIYNSLLGTKEQAVIALASTISNSKVLEDALPNPEPVKPNGRSVKILAFFIGLLIPAGIIMLIELFNDKVNSKIDIERNTTATILGELGHSSETEPLVVKKNNRKVIAEQFRILRSNLQYVLRNIEKPVILVTSSYSGEGKSFVSTNLGAVMSLSNKKTIILEFDIRKPKVLSHLGLPKRPGLTNYLLGSIDFKELPVAVPGYEDLYVLPCGPLPPNPAELLLDSKLDDLFVHLKSNFDTIIIDTAPVGMVSDALTLSRFADCTLFIVRERHTLKKQIGSIDQYYMNNRLPRISIVLNDAKGQANGGYYGYGNNNGSGYFEEESSRTPISKLFNWFGGKNGVSKKTKTKV